MNPHGYYIKTRLGIEQLGRYIQPGILCVEEILRVIPTERYEDALEVSDRVVKSSASPRN